MALILSTHSTNGGLTGDQARVQNFLSFQNTDFVVDNHGGELACTQNGSSISVASGIAVLMGTVIENTAAYPLTFNLTGSGSAMVIAKVNLGTGVPALEIKQGTTLIQNDLISNQTGTREYELYRITYANSVITGFADKRLIVGKASSVPAGVVHQYAGATAPEGYLLCDGAAISRTTYAELFAAIGTAYGTGNGSTTFNVPNAKGKTFVGLDSTITDFNALGKTGGEKTHQLTNAELPAGTYASTDDALQGAEGASGHWMFDSAFNRQGLGTAHNNMPPFLISNYIIKY